MLETRRMVMHNVTIQGERRRLPLAVVRCSLLRSLTHSHSHANTHGTMQLSGSLVSRALP